MCKYEVPELDYYKDTRRNILLRILWLITVGMESLLILETKYNVMNRAVNAKAGQSIL